MKIRTVQHTSGVVNQVTVKITKRDLAKIFVLMSTVTCVASLPASYLRRNLVDEAVRRIDDAVRQDRFEQNRSGEDA